MKSSEAQGFNPSKIQHIDTARVRYPERYSLEQFKAPEGAEISEYERTVDGYFELEWNYYETQRALNLDHDYQMSSLSNEDIAKAAAPVLEAINQERSTLVEAQGVDPEVLPPLSAGYVRPEGISDEEAKSQATRHRNNLIRLARPDWLNLSQVEVNALPINLRANVNYLGELDAKLRTLSNDAELMAEIASERVDDIEAKRAAAMFSASYQKTRLLRTDIAKIRGMAAASNRTLTNAEKRLIESMQAQMADIERRRGSAITSEAMKEKVAIELSARENRKDRRDFEKGLLVNDQMEEIIEDLLPSLAAGRPALLVGETGGAKTALARHISREYFAEPELVPGQSDVNIYQLFGHQVLKNDEGVTVSDQKLGPVAIAMSEGRPLILDEINANPSEIVKVFNEILQLKAGDTFRVPGGNVIEVKPGFVVIATMNEKSKRYKGVDDLSAELLNRFGANVIRVRYPDHDTVYGHEPTELMKLARIALSDRDGVLDESVISREDLSNFVRASHVSQQVFTANYGQGGLSDYVPAETRVDGKPGLQESVLAPRTMVAILEKVKLSGGQTDVRKVLETFVLGIKDPSDRKVMERIIHGHDLSVEDNNSTPQPAAPSSPAPAPDAS